MSDHGLKEKSKFSHSSRYQHSSDSDSEESRRREHRTQSSTNGDRSQDHNSKHQDRSRSDERLYRKRSRSPKRYARDDKTEKRPRYEGGHRESSRSYEAERRRSSLPRSRDARKRSRTPEISRRSHGPLPSQNDAFKNNDKSLNTDKPVLDKQKPNFGATGRLAAEANAVKVTDGQTIVLKYHEPPEARKPPDKEPWRMYVFKGADIVDTVELAEQSCWLFGREVAVADFPVEHPSCSKQHAVIQFRYIEKRNEYGDKKGRVRPYVIDLESSNGTKVNGDQIPAGRYVELRDKDVIHFGHSSREYVVQLPPAL